MSIKTFFDVGILSFFDETQVGFTSGLIYRACVETVYPPIETSRLTKDQIRDPIQLIQVVLTYFDPTQFTNTRLSWNKYGPSEILFPYGDICHITGLSTVPEAKAQQGGKFKLDLLVIANSTSWIGYECKVDQDKKGLEDAIQQVKIYNTLTTNVLTTTSSTFIQG